MDSLESMARRVAADPARKAVLTTRGRVDSRSPGPALRRTLDEMREHLVADRENAVLVWTGSAWMAVMRDRSSPSKYEVWKLPTDDLDNLVGDSLQDARQALEAALQV